MKTFSVAIATLVIGAALGLWTGVNLGKGNPLLSNPFKDRTVTERVADAGKDLLSKGERTVNEGAEMVKEKLGMDDCK